MIEKLKTDEELSCATYIECQDYFDDSKFQDIIIGINNKINELIEAHNKAEQKCPVSICKVCNKINSLNVDTKGWVLTKSMFCSCKPSPSDEPKDAQIEFSQDIYNKAWPGTSKTMCDIVADELIKLGYRKITKPSDEELRGLVRQIAGQCVSNEFSITDEYIEYAIAKIKELFNRA